MKWNKYTLTTTTGAVDMISYTLGELGIEGIEVQDKVPLSKEDQEKMFIDILPDLGPDDGKAYVTFYLDQRQDPEDKINRILDAMSDLRAYVDIGEGTLVKSETDDEDWLNNWKKYWKPFMVDESIMIKPTWEKRPDVSKDTLVVELDPGTSFGTGMHHTTKLCIHQIRKYLKGGDELLDVGCGSGILSIIGLMLGAGHVTATDIDPAAVSAAAENAQVNHLDMEQLTILQGDMISDRKFAEEIGKGKYDLIVSNILADVITSLSAVIGENLKPGGIFISSGILDTKEQNVRQALLENGFEILEETQSGEWRSFTARRPI